jgi:hypothetical protein
MIDPTILNATMNAERDRLRAENARLREELAALAVESAAMTTECHLLQARIAVVEAEAARLRRSDADTVVWARRLTEGIEIMKRQLATIVAARDEACDLALDDRDSRWQWGERIEALRKVDGL